jgi:hypothetical protein
MGITNIYIDKLLTPLCADFEGTFSADTIPQHLSRKDRFSLIANLSEEKEAGTHFITIVGRPNFMLYIDSIGLPCTNIHIRNFLKSCKRKLLYNTVVIQHPNNDFCGYFAILYVLLNDSAIRVKPKVRFYKAPHRYAENNKKCIDYISTMLKNS